jgi:hypothetical protein
VDDVLNRGRRLGNTGAATFFAQTAIRVMGSYIDGGTSAAINLRDTPRKHRLHQPADAPQGAGGPRHVQAQGQASD